MPLPVAGAFDRVGVDVVQFVPPLSGNKYAIVFIDYLTKWVEVYVHVTMEPGTRATDEEYINYCMMLPVTNLIMVLLPVSWTPHTL